jgi:N6-L-threonylcarbamoyladenine synthase
MQKDIICLAIESSCDETSMSLIKNGQEELATVVLTQIDIHKTFGGVVPEIASRSHVENITIVIEELFSKTTLTLDDIDIIGVTYGPGLIGSLLIGLQAAKTIALITNKPLIPVHHIAGHIYANNLEKRLQFPLIALVVSGGHTDLVYMKEDYSFERIGSTLDDAVGEAYDKVAKILGLSYPGGPIIDNLAKKGNDTYNLPLPLNDESYNFSFSGIKSAVVNIVHNEKQRGNTIRIEDMCTSFQNRAISILSKKTMKAIKEYKVKNLILAGGVSANSGLRENLTKLCQENNINISMPQIKYCTDNAAMIGAAAYYAYQKGITANLTLNAKATDSLYQGTDKN